MGAIAIDRIRVVRGSLPRFDCGDVLVGADSAIYQIEFLPTDKSAQLHPKPRCPAIRGRLPRRIEQMDRALGLVARLVLRSGRLSASRYGGIPATIDEPGQLSHGILGPDRTQEPRLGRPREGRK